MKRKLVYVLAFGLTSVVFLVSAKSLYNYSVYHRAKEARDTAIILPTTEEQHYEFEGIEYDWGILFKEKTTGEEYKFVYDEPIVDDSLDPESDYYILEESLPQDPKKRSTREICETIGDMYDFDPTFLMVMCIQESQCDPEASNGDDFGIMQIRERWHKDRMQRLGCTDLLDPYSNILVATDFLAELTEDANERDDVDGDMAYILMRYNMSIEAAEDLWAQGETSEYAQDVIRMSEELKEELRRD